MKYFIVLLFAMITISTTAQDHYQAIGVRGGISSGITYKRFLDNENAFEGILSFKKGIRAILLKEFHQPRFSEFSENLYLYHGFGGHFGFLKDEFNSEKIEIFNSELHKSPSTPIIGLDALIAMEYRFETVPFVFALEYKPYFDLFGENILDLHMADFAFALRYIY